MPSVKGVLASKRLVSDNCIETAGIVPKGLGKLELPVEWRDADGRLRHLLCDRAFEDRFNPDAHRSSRALSLRGVCVLKEDCDYSIAHFAR